MFGSTQTQAVTRTIVSDRDSEVNTLTVTVCAVKTEVNAWALYANQPANSHSPDSYDNR